MDSASNLATTLLGAQADPLGLLASDPLIPEALRAQLTFGVLGGCAGLFVGLVLNLVLARFTGSLPEGTLRRALLAAWVGPVRWMIAVLGVMLGVGDALIWDQGLLVATVYWVVVIGLGVWLLLLGIARL